MQMQFREKREFETNAARDSRGPRRFGPVTSASRVCLRRQKTQM